VRPQYTEVECRLIRPDSTGGSPCKGCPPQGPFTRPRYIVCERESASNQRATLLPKQA